MKRATQTFHAHADTLSVRVTIYIPRSGPTMTMWPKCDRRPKSVHQDVWLKESMRSWCAGRGLWGVDMSPRGQYYQANQTAWGVIWFGQAPGLLLGCLPFRASSAYGNSGEGSGTKAVGSDAWQENGVPAKALSGCGWALGECPNVLSLSSSSGHIVSF